MSFREPAPINFSEKESSALDVATTIWHPPMTLDLLNGESDTKQTSSDGQDLAQSLVSTTSAKDSHYPASNDCPGESDRPSSADLKLDGSSQSGVDDKKKVDCSNRMICHENVSNGNEKKQSPSKARLWLADTPEMFYVVDSKAIPSHLSASTNSGLARMKRYDGTSQLGGLLKKENVAYSVDNLALKMKRYNATSELSLYKNTVLKQTSSNAQCPAQILPETASSTDIARTMKRYNATSQLSVYQGQETASLLKRVSPDEDYPIQSFPESVSSTDIARKMKRYNATSELSLYKEQETTSVLEQTSSCAPLPAQSLPETDPSTEKNSPVAKDVINDGGHASPRLACSESDNGHELPIPKDTQPETSNQMISHGSVSNEQEKAQPATNGRYWFEETPESFDAIERVQSANGSNSSDSTESTANVEHKGSSKEQKKIGLFSCWRVPLLKKHKKKQTRSNELNGDQPSTVAISTTADTFVTSEPVDTVEAPNPFLFTTLRDCSTFFRVPYNPISPAKAHEIEAARIRMEAFLAEKALADKSNGLATAKDVIASAGTSQVHKTDPLPKSAGSSNNDCPVARHRQDQKQKTQPIIPKFVWRPDEQISPASKKDLANAEKRMQMYFASKNLSMPGAASSGKPVDTAPSTSDTSTSTAGVPVGSAEALKNVFAVQLPK